MSECWKYFYNFIFKQKIPNHIAIIWDFLFEYVKYQGNFGNLLKSGLRFSTKALRPSFASSDK